MEKLLKIRHPTSHAESSVLPDGIAAEGSSLEKHTERKSDSKCLPPVPHQFRFREISRTKPDFV